MLCGGNGQRLITDAARERLRNTVANAKDFFFNRMYPPNGGFGLAPCFAGIGAMPLHSEHGEMEMPDFGYGTEQRGKPEIMRFDGKALGIFRDEIIESTHRMISLKAYELAGNQFDKETAGLFVPGLIAEYSERPDTNDTSDNNKGHCFNSHETHDNSIIKRKCRNGFLDFTTILHQYNEQQKLDAGFGWKGRQIEFTLENFNAMRSIFDKKEAEATIRDAKGASYTVRFSGGEVEVVRKASDPGDALKRIELCCEAIDIAMKGPNMVGLAIHKIKWGKTPNIVGAKRTPGPLSNLAEEMMRRIYGSTHEKIEAGLEKKDGAKNITAGEEEKTKVTLLGKIGRRLGFGSIANDPDKPTLLGKIAFGFYWIAQFIEETKLRFFPEKPLSPEKAQATAVSMILGQMLHYIQDIESIWHTAGYVETDGEGNKRAKRWVVEYPLVHGSFDLVIARHGARPEGLKIGRFSDRIGSLFHPVNINGVKDNPVVHAMLKHFDPEIKPCHDWKDAIAMSIFQRAAIARAEADSLIAKRKAGEVILTPEEMGKAVTNAIEISADVMVTVANSQRKPAVASNGANGKKSRTA